MNHVMAKLQENWRAGITVGLVSIPLSVSLAVASLATPTMGIITAVWAGLFAALFGGSKFNIVGPTGALSGLLAAYAFSHGAQTLPMVAFVAGILVLIAWALKLERWLIFVPGSAIHGFTLGVAFIISLNQLDYALGLVGVPKHEKFIENVIESLSHVGQTAWPSAVLFVIALGLLFLLLKKVPKIPGVIVLTPVAVLIGKLATEGHLPFQLLTLKDKFADIGGRLFEFHGLVMPDNTLITTALAVALIAIIETMVSAKMADGMTGTKYDRRKEMFGLGLANLASGFMGGLPATAALARTSTNVKNGATHQTAAMISSATVVIVSLLLLPWFKYVPMAFIAAVLVFVAVRMVEMHHLKRYWQQDRRGFAIAMITALISVVEDPIMGVAFGTVAALLVFAEKIAHGPFELVLQHADGCSHKIVHEKEEAPMQPDDVLIYSFTGQLAYLNAESHLEHFHTKAHVAKTIILRLRHLYLLDVDGLDALEEIVDELEKEGKLVAISGINPLIKDMLEKSRVYKTLKEKGRIYDRTSHAIKEITCQ
ncbi:SulP family inorganic anion transporter [Patescibacteria group bacterium]|nr:SulP family inorganic anion transporter [Patescibacteria group bacterium]